MTTEPKRIAAALLLSAATALCVDYHVAMRSPDADGTFSWTDPAAVGRALRVCPPLEAAGSDRHGRPREGDRVQAGADVQPLD